MLSLAVGGFHHVEVTFRARRGGAARGRRADPGASGPRRPRPAGKARYGTWGVDLDGRDMAVKPGDDFYRYANGTWLQRTPIPADRTSWSLWTVLCEEIEQQIRAIVTTRPPRATGQRKVGDFYAAWMDEAGIEARGTAPLRPYLDRIAAVRNRDELLACSRRRAIRRRSASASCPIPPIPPAIPPSPARAGSACPIAIIICARARNMTATAPPIATMSSSFTGSPASRPRGQSRSHHRPRAADRRGALDAGAQRDIRQIYNLMNREQLAALAPQFQWTATLQRRGLGAVPTVIATETTAIAAIGAMLDDVPSRPGRTIWPSTSSTPTPSILPRAFDEANFASSTARWAARSASATAGSGASPCSTTSMGEAVGKIYVERHFPAESRRQMNELIGNLRAAFEERLRGSTGWTTRPAPRRSPSSTFEPRIGRPGGLIDYSRFRVDRADLLGNIVRAAEFDWNLQLSRLPGPVDRGSGR